MLTAAFIFDILHHINTPCIYNYFIFTISGAEAIVEGLFSREWTCIPRKFGFTFASKARAAAKVSDSVIN